MANVTEQIALRLHGTFARAACSYCKGRGRVPCPRTFGVRGSNRHGGFKQVSDGHPIPCPECMGTGISVVHVEQADAGGVR